MIHEYTNGQTMILHGVAVAKKLGGRPEWRVNCLTGAIWESTYIPGKMTNVKFVKSKAAAKRLMIELANRSASA